MGFEATFLNTYIHGQGACCEIGNIALTPYRYLFGGRDVEIIAGGDKPGIHHVASFHPFGDRNKCQTNPNFHSSSMCIYQTALAIACLVPGLILGLILKGIGYLDNDVQETHQRVVIDVLSKPLNQSFNNILQKTGDAFMAILDGQRVDDLDVMGDMMPQRGGFDQAWKNRILNIQTIGTTKAPIENEFQLGVQLRQLDPLQPIDALIIQGNGKLQIHGNDLIPQLNPMKVVLIGARLGNVGLGGGHRLGSEDDPAHLQQPQQPLRKVLRISQKWQLVHAQSVKEALEADLITRDCLSGKQWHVLYEVDAPVKKAKKKSLFGGHGRLGGPDDKPKKPGGQGPKGNIHGVHDRQNGGWWS